jgi:hypothetical protein
MRNRHHARTASDVHNAMDEAIETILRLAELGPAIDGNPELFPHCIELLALIAQQSAHIERLSHQLATLLRPSSLVAMEGPSWP